ncbi:DoxX family protein [Martelella sp. HB161492]|uniref:DoxX family protein n=1 Tax=Martelella sp. HB161492 TaxID=2720726 RepID=UPI00158FB1C4|nr:DoxX family protein [Martelella sp. HB161492]
MIDLKTAPYAALLLRVVTGLLFITHGLTKLFVFTPAGTMGYFSSLGLPGFLGIIVMILEIVGGVALILGVKTREFSFVLGLELLGAALFGHIQNGFSFANPNGGGWEYPVMWAFVQFALALLGDGVHALLPSRRLK